MHLTNWLLFSFYIVLRNSIPYWEYNDRIFHLEQISSTYDPRATCSPGQLVMWPHKIIIKKYKIKGVFIYIHEIYYIFYKRPKKNPLKPKGWTRLIYNESEHWYRTLHWPSEQLCHFLCKYLPSSLFYIFLNFLMEWKKGKHKCRQILFIFLFSVQNHLLQVFFIIIYSGNQLNQELCVFTGCFFQQLKSYAEQAILQFVFKIEGGKLRVSIPHCLPVRNSLHCLHTCRHMCTHTHKDTQNRRRKSQNSI